MESSSIAARAPGHRVMHRPASVREYRRERKHLYPLEEFREAVATGGVVSSFCGLDMELPRGRGVDVVEVKEPAADDCITCVDVWHDCELVRL